MPRILMERSGEMEIFARVVQEGGFSAAARSLDLTPSAVSRVIARLEERLGARLLMRTTRALSLTEEGETY
ncbi:MAG TPA: LysR family transcriptional regulator, partial [Acidocella sp.]|nr:LysR family transcriptional regulator [Acidocella sp.]